MRTEAIQKRRVDYKAISRASIKRDFKNVHLHHEEPKRREIENSPEIGTERRVAFVGEQSSYFRQRSFLVGKLVRFVRQSSVGGWVCEFVHDEDRQALNMAAGWSNMKSEYLLDGCKFR